MTNIKEEEKANLIMSLRSMGIISHDVLSALESTPREIFIPKHLSHYAYENRALPIGFHQTISQPYIVALMTEKLSLNSNDIVLEIGTGSGYQTAIISKLVRKVYTIERINPLLVEAKSCFKRLKLTNIVTKTDDGFTGWLNMSPFDKIIITCSLSSVHEDLLFQLKVGGKCIAPIGNNSGKQILKCITISNKREKDNWEDICEVKFVPLIRNN